jgi:hypothetical protein
MSARTYPNTITIVKEGISREISFAELEIITGASYAPQLEFASYSLLKKILQKKRQKLSAQRLWLSAYFKPEVLDGTFPPVSIRYVDRKMGWGVFAEKEISSMSFISEYSGKVRPRGRNDAKNSYCFEYLLDPDEETPYLIDAQDQGGISRYINHHSIPNLASTFILIDSVPHIILYTAKVIAKGEQLFYDYGPDYWKKRPIPIT